MKKITLLFISVLFLTFAKAQAWLPAGADTSFPRTIIHTSEIPALRSALAFGVNIGLYNDVYNNAVTTPPASNVSVSDKSQRAAIAKNAAFVLLLGVKPFGNTTISLSTGEKTSLKNTAITLLAQINTYIPPITTDSPANFDQWQWNSKEIINFVCAYDLLRGSGATESELSAGRDSIRSYVGNLYYEAIKSTLGFSFFQGTKNNHALMSAGAIGIAAVVLNNLKDTVPPYSPTSWINCAMWNIHNIMWWDIKKQSTIGQYAGYAEGSYYFKYGFMNVLPFFRSMGYFMKDTVLNYEFIDVNRKIRNPWYDTNYVKIYDWFEAIRMPDGRMPPIEDSYTYRCFPEMAILHNSKYNWPLHLSSLDPGQNNSLSEQLATVYDFRANYIAANTSQIAFADSLFKVFPDAGIAVFRSSWDSSATYFALTGKNGNALASADAHNQADDGSFLMMVNGQMMALDPGYLSYEMRDTVARAQAHNMLLVNGQATLKGAPGKSNGANCYIEKTFSSAVQNYAELRTNYQNTDINRKVMFVRNKYFLVIDHLSGFGPQQYSFLLHGYGLNGGDITNTGIFTDLTANNRGAWQRRNSGLYAVVNSDANFSMSKQTGVHEYSYQNIQNHTFIEAKTTPITSASYLTCLQPFKNISTDTFPVLKLNLPSAVCYKINDGSYTDVAVTKSGNSFISIPKSTTGLSNDYATNAQYFWVSEKSGNAEDLFMHKGNVLKRDADTLIYSANTVNIQYVKTGAKTYKGFCGDTGWVDFYTGEYPFMFGGNGIWFVKYDKTRKVASAYFANACNFSFILDDTKTGTPELAQNKANMKIYPNPATEKLDIDFDQMTESGTRISLFDLTGKVVFESTLEFNSKRISIDISSVNNGIYFARLSNQHGIASPVKVIINR